MNATLNELVKQRIQNSLNLVEGRHADEHRYHWVEHHRGRERHLEGPGLERQLLAEDHALGQLAERELRAFRKNGSKGVTWQQVKKELEGKGL